LILILCDIRPIPAFFLNLLSGFGSAKIGVGLKLTKLYTKNFVKKAMKVSEIDGVYEVFKNLNISNYLTKSYR
jgi:hypothetical protein